MWLFSVYHEISTSLGGGGDMDVGGCLIVRWSDASEAEFKEEENILSVV